MLLRSSSTPILGSLLASSSCSSPYFSESPGHGTGCNPLERTHSDTIHGKLSFPHGGAAHNHGHNHSHPLNASSFHGFSLQLSNPPTASPAEPHPGAPVGFRRVQSEGNLKEMAVADLHDEHRRPSNLPQPNKSHRRPPPVLETIPSFSVYSSRFDGRYGEAVVEEEEDELDEEEMSEESPTTHRNVVGEFFSSGEKGKVVMKTGGEPGVSPLFLARGLGLEFGDTASGLILGIGDSGGGIGGGGGAGGRSLLVDSSGSQSDMEAYYKKMVEEDPGNSLLLRNYAQFLYKSKGDLQRAEEYYSRAMLAEPGDGEVLSQYAKLMWELHHDRERASGYFEQAVQAAPQDSHVLASYAGFLWEAEEDEDDDDGDAAKSEAYFAGAQVPFGALASAAHPRPLSC
ncbi:unnamed protein product [Spirodela intermedia]|uniref:Uncharacterized protein n=1 Tax=Spirodela intermedia TaxID=51605 RepID=A0A7I8KMC4_SPIIN|nr:unnamed protein product [Spirodela intermedia]